MIIGFERKIDISIKISMHASNLYRPFATAEIDKMIYRFKTFKFKVFIDTKKPV